MCGIIAVLRRRSQRAAPDAQEVRGALADAIAAMPDAGDEFDGLVPRLEAAGARLQQLDSALWGPPGLECLFEHPELPGELDDGLAELGRRVRRIEEALDERATELPPDRLELVNAALVGVKDAVWAVRRDRLRAQREIEHLAGRRPARGALEVYASVQTALSAIDRLEVRGRDSAGLHLLVTGHGLDLEDPGVRALFEQRASDGLFRSRAVRTPEDHLSFVYKAAAEIGELGDNTRTIRDAIRGDELLRLATESPDVEATVLGHTRWASVGIISEANAHPLNHEEAERVEGPFVTAALNGDVDNYADLKARARLEFPPEITTDAKIIPALMSRSLEEGQAADEAFRRTVASFEGSVAITASTAEHPDQLLLALRGSGQALYIGLCEDAFVVASEPYGVVEQTPVYLRMDGETPGNPQNAAGSRGQVVVLDRGGAGEVAGIRRLAYDGTPLPVGEEELHRAQITTRDIDRGDFRHYLLKEITEAPRSMTKTLRGKIVEDDGRLAVRLGEDTLPARVRERLAAGAIRQVLVIGQGTAAVAGQGVATILDRLLTGSGLVVRALPATELSGFGLRDDMSDTLVVAISQSGTTTDTNRTVDLVRGRGAQVVSIVNRRNSDLTDKSDGVLYTSDGRDVEMSVASTKAFYAQVGAGALLSAALATALGRDQAIQDELLRGLRELPALMTEVLARSEEIGRIAREHAPSRRHWAVVGNGPNRIAAEEVRIKLSELCYKSIACDATEDKKHIDLSAEPLILVCAAGLTGSTVDDVAKEVAIYRAHKAAPIVVATAGEGRFLAALEVIPVPRAHPWLSFVLSAVAGHLFGYHAAQAIDELALPLREIRSSIEQLVSSLDVGENPLERLGPLIHQSSGRFFHELRCSRYDGTLEASTAVRIGSLVRYASGLTPLESYAAEHGRAGSPGIVIEELTAAITRGIEELTRPIDAIKHQAKTVTVGISRSDEALLTVPLVREVLATGTARDQLQYADLRTLAALEPAVEQVLGFTRYGIRPGAEGEEATIHVVGQGGIAQDLRSRTAENPVLRGTKHRVADERRVAVARGRSDQRTVVLVPEIDAGRTVGLSLLHVAFHDRLPAELVRSVLDGYRDRYDALRDAVLETEPSFRDDLLGEIPVIDLLTDPIHLLADRWRSH